MSPLQTGVLATYWGSPKGVTTYSKLIHDLWSLNYYIALPIAAIVLGGILWCVVRYRARPGDDRKARQFQYHIPIEATYTIIPLILVAVIFGYMYGIENKETHVSKHPGLVIKVQAFQWGWRFTYPNGHQELGSVATEPNINDESALPVLYMPTHETVQIDLSSVDVIHTFYVPEFLYNRDAIPGVKNQVDFNVTTAGQWIGECNQLCGTYHAFMRFEVDAMPKAAFDAWYHAQKPNSLTIAGASKS
ncbi:MAG TPA: cytochrome c oxidase subunit II [Acidimicrobiales bacterium]|nr:cytochrome c oxidase subunit II [Acidimicrobiales bacterium]